MENPVTLTSRIITCELHTVLQPISICGVKPTTGGHPSNPREQQPCSKRCLGNKMPIIRLCPWVTCFYPSTRESAMLKHLGRGTLLRVTYSCRWISAPSRDMSFLHVLRSEAMCPEMVIIRRKDRKAAHSIIWGPGTETEREDRTMFYISLSLQKL